MKVSQNTQGQLVLETRPNWLMVLLSTILIALGAYIAVFPGKETVLDCERKGTVGDCAIIENQTYGRRLVVRIPMRLIQGAQATPAAISKSYRFSRLELLVNDGKGPFPFTWYGSHEAATAAALRIREYLADPHEVFLKLSVDRRPFFFAVGGVLLAMGLAMLGFGAQSLRSTFSPGDGTVTVRRLSWRGLKAATYPFAAIADLHVGGIRQDCNLFLKLESGQLVALSTSADMEAMVGPRRIRAIREGTAERVRAFIVPT